MPARTRAVTRYVPRTRTRWVSRARSRRRARNRKISVAVIASALYPAADIVRWYRMYTTGFGGPAAGTDIVAKLRSAGQAFLTTTTGMTWTSVGFVWKPTDALWATWLPLAAGWGVHKLANTFGLNRMLKRVPYVQV